METSISKLREWPHAKASISPPYTLKHEGNSVPTAFTTATIVAAGLLPTSFAAAIYSSVPGMQDGWSAVGAGLATVIAATAARKMDKSLSHTITVIVASFFCGILVPSAVMWWGFREQSNEIIWSVWCLLGFAVGLSGWSAVAAFMAVIPSLMEQIVGLLPDFALKWLNRTAKKVDAARDTTQP